MNLLNLSVIIHVLQIGSQVLYEKTIDEVMGQRVYGVLPLNYGAMIYIKVAPVGLEPTTSGL